MEQADPVTAEGVVGVYFCPYKVKRSNVGDVCLVILSDANWVPGYSAASTPGSLCLSMLA